MGLPACRRGTGGATAPIPYHKGETCHSLKENFRRNKSLSASPQQIRSAAFEFSGRCRFPRLREGSHTAADNAKRPLLRQWFPLAAVQKIIAVACLPMTAPVQLLCTAFDVDEPTLAQNTQRPFHAGARALTDCRDGLEFYAAGIPAPRAVFQIAVHCELDRRQAELKNRTAHLE